MTPQLKALTVPAKAYGKGVQADEDPDLGPPPRAITGHTCRAQSPWLRHAGPSPRHAAVRTACARPTLLRHHGDRARTSMEAIDVVAGRRGENGESGMWVRRGLASLEHGGHLAVDRGQARGRGHFHRYALILRASAA